MTLAAGDAQQRLSAHDEEHALLVAHARRALERDRPEAAAAWAQIAGHHAWMNHTGRFASPELEAVLAQLGARLPSPAPARPAAPRPQEILHVVTQCYGTGGSTQAIACWVEQDHEVRHRVCITRQRGVAPPEKILAPLRAPSDLIRLDTRRGGLVQRAARLRALAAEADVVVLHLHPYDVVPAIAFAEARDLPPVVFVDHCDHVFWLGTGAARVFMHMRDSGRLLAGARRGIDPARSTVVPRPLRPAERSRARDEAKRALGIAPEQVLLVTAADGTKYRPVSAPGFLDLVVPVVERHDDVLLHAAGPPEDAAWRAAAERTGGRVRALGPLPDVRLLQEAADVYLDSYPFSSLTSLLEAGSLGVPAITFRGHPDACAVLGADTRGVDEWLVRAADAGAYASALEALIADPAGRRERGARMERAIRETHTGDGWLAAVEELYALAAEAEAPAPARAVAPQAGPLDVLVDRVMTETGFAQGALGATREHLALLPARERVAAWRDLTRAGRRPPSGHVVPEWTLARLRRYREAARGLTSRSPSGA